MRMRASFALLLAFVSFASAQRLPKDAVPSNYKIDFQVDLAAATFTGDETIQLKLAKPSRTVTLHSVDLNLTEVSVTAGGKKQEGKVTPNTEAEMVVFEFPQELPAGTAQLHIRFNAKLRDDLRGFYITRSNRRAYAATQFEGTYARMMFPSFDEPEFKASFDISVETDAKDTAISNGAILNEAPTTQGKHLIKFATSPKISTYLVALAVGDFGCVEGSSDAIPIRICAVPEKKEMGTFALKAAENFLHFYNGWYGIKYPFRKLDMVALPNYEWGGMENTAAVFYKERALLIDEKTASVGSKRGVASVVAHEMAHQWFGDLVTMQWWDNVWLNEGFATWMTPKALQQWNPNRDQDIPRTLNAQFAVGQDSLASTRPIRANASTSAEIKELFDGVAYEKGGAVLRMVEKYLGEETFRAGVNRYLQKHANGNATAEDLWTELTAVSKKPVDKIMASFIDQAGVPLLTVTSSGCTNSKSAFLNIKQERFGSAATATQTWNIPLCFKNLNGGEARCELITKAEQAIGGVCGPHFVNAGASGYYRTMYDAESFVNISDAAAAGKLNAAESILLLSDQWALVREGKVQIGDFLDLAGNMKARTENDVLRAAFNRTADIRGTFTNDKTQPKFDAWWQQLIRPALDRVGLEPKPNDTDEDRDLRPQLFALMGDTGDRATLERARKLTDQALADPGSVDANIAGIAFAIAAEHGDAALYDRIFTAWKNAKSPEQSTRWLLTLPHFQEPALIKRNLEFVRSPQIPAQDVIGFMSGMINNDAARDLAWAFLKEHWTEMREKVVSFGGGGAVAALSSYCDLEHRKDIEDFFKQNRAPGAERTVRQTLERISACVAFKQKQQSQFDKWLSSN